MISTYTVLPHTSMPNGDIISQTPPHPNRLTQSQCQRLCNSLSDCVAYEYNPVDGCHVKGRITSTRVKPNSTVFIKGQNSSYWWLWVILIIIGLGIFLTMCKN